MKGRFIVRVAKFGLIALTSFGILFLLVGLVSRVIGYSVSGVVFLIVVTIFFFSGLKSIPEEQRWITQVFGEYYFTFKQGVHWLVPLLVKVRTFVSVWEQRYPLFEPEIKVDFKNGSATPKGAYVFVKCDEEKDAEAPYKMVYKIKNVDQATVSLTESSLRTYCNNLKVDAGIMLGRGGSNVLEQIEKDPVGKAMVEKVQAALSEWGLKMTKITIRDWDLDPAIIEAREGVVRGERAVDEAKFRAIQKARESGGMHAEIRKMLTKKPYNYSLEEAEKIAAEYVKYWKGTETGRIIDWRGGEGLISEFAKIVVGIDLARESLKKKGG